MRLRVYQVDFRRTKAGWEAHKGKYLVQIVPDELYPNMWRIVRPADGSLTGMVNLTRAKDAALGIIEGLEFVNAPVPVL